MATALTPAHRSWRVKVFAATWLSYVGFYFCRKPFSAAKSAIGHDTGWSTTTLGNIWAAYLIRDRAVPVATALAQTRSINLRDDAPFGGQQPIEGFLGRPVPELAKPK